MVDQQDWNTKNEENHEFHAIEDLLVQNICLHEVLSFHTETLEIGKWDHDATSDQEDHVNENDKDRVLQNQNHSIKLG